MLGNTDIFVAEPGDVIHIHSPGGGGRGSPLDREADRVLTDVERGYVSLEAAQRLYGVVIEDGRIDAAATRAARDGAARPQDHFKFGPEREAYELIWTPAQYGILTAIMAALPVHWRFFVKTKIFEAVRDAGTTGQEADVRQAFAAVRANFPQVPAVDSAADSRGHR
jgi:N-methylhydantoinase B